MLEERGNSEVERCLHKLERKEEDNFQADRPRTRSEAELGTEVVDSSAGDWDYRIVLAAVADHS